MNKPSNYVLGLDMGVASIGWAAVSKEEKFVDSGVRIFPAGADITGAGADTHPNQQRRKKRAARRRNARKAERRKVISSCLRQLGWMPEGEKELAAWYGLDVYDLRARGLNEKLTLQEFGRILLHLNQRRGFLSLRKSEVNAAEGKDKKKLEGMLGEISALQKDIDSSGLQTLGAYLNDLYSKKGIHIRIRSRHIRRQMLLHEFSCLWEAQAKHHPELTDSLRWGTHGKQEDPCAVTKPVPRDHDQTMLEQFGFENLTFFQRKVYWPVSSIGKCEFEKDELRAPIADRRFQEFRMLSELNNLRILDNSAAGKPEERKLGDEEREAAIVYLSKTQKPTLTRLKKVIGKLPDSPEEAQITFNLEAGQRTGIGGLATNKKLFFPPGFWEKRRGKSSQRRPKTRLWRL